MLIKRESNSGSRDLHVVYRPCKVDELIGNEPIRNKIKNGLDKGTLPHTHLFVGDSGCGKTTLARIIAFGLVCENSNGMTSEPCLKCTGCRALINYNHIDVMEINIGQEGTKGSVDGIIKTLPYSPSRAKNKILILDEAHFLTKEAMGLLLKNMEDGYSHVYFIFCTNHPEKLPKEFRNRCNVSNFEKLSEEDILGMLVNVCDFEGTTYNIDVLSLLSLECGGVPRQALVWLRDVIDDSTWDIEIAKKVVQGITSNDEINIMEISKLLEKGSFKGAVELYDRLKLPAETVRIAIAGFFAWKLKNIKTMGQGMKYSAILDILSTNIYDNGKGADHKIYNMMFKLSELAGRK